MSKQLYNNMYIYRRNNTSANDKKDLHLYYLMMHTGANPVQYIYLFDMASLKSDVSLLVMAATSSNNGFCNGDNTA